MKKKKTNSALIILLAGVIFICISAVGIGVGNSIETGETKTVKCFDKYGNKILGLECEQKIPHISVGISAIFGAIGCFIAGVGAVKAIKEL
jgi:F0F1-type ATP synthase membrane subunit c/vacuolar-type H+-ATPase subunit K